MVGIGVLMMLIGLWSGFQRLRGGLYQSKMLHRSAVLMGPLGFVAVIAGWVVTEVGRQPWVIQGLLRTSEAVSPVDAVGVGASLLALLSCTFSLRCWYRLYLKKDGRRSSIPTYLIMLVSQWLQNVSTTRRNKQWITH